MSQRAEERREKEKRCWLHIYDVFREIPRLDGKFDIEIFFSYLRFLKLKIYLMPLYLMNFFDLQQF
jgi:hypothetical protein